MSPMVRSGWQDLPPRASWLRRRDRRRRCRHDCFPREGSITEDLRREGREAMFDSIMTRRSEETAIDIVNAVLGVCLALAPWALGFTGEVAAAWNAWIVGAAIALVAVGALVAVTQWGGVGEPHFSASGLSWPLGCSASQVWLMPPTPT